METRGSVRNGDPPVEAGKGKTSVVSSIKSGVLSHKTNKQIKEGNEEIKYQKLALSYIYMHPSAHSRRH